MFIFNILANFWDLFGLITNIYNNNDNNNDNFDIFWNS